MRHLILSMFYVSFANYVNSFKISILGYLWIFINPVMMLAIYSVVFSYILAPKLDIAYDNAYTLYIAVALLPWSIFSNAVVSGSSSLTANSGFIRKLNTPLYIYVFKSTLEHLYNMIPILIVLSIFLVYSGVAPTIYWVAVLIPLFFLSILAVGVGMILSTIDVFFRDVERFMGILMQFVMWSIPIVYPWTIIPEDLRWVVFSNPLFYYFNAFREILLYGEMISLNYFLFMAVSSFAVFLFGLWMIRSAEDKIRDVL